MHLDFSGLHLCGSLGIDATGNASYTATKLGEFMK